MALNKYSTVFQQFNMAATLTSWIAYAMLLQRSETSEHLWVCSIGFNDKQKDTLFLLKYLNWDSLVNGEWIQVPSVLSETLIPYPFAPLIK